VTSLRITEIFHSLQGEARTVGIPTVFIRLTGCPLRCRWCDTPYSFSGGSLKTIEDIVQETQKFGTKYVCITGGEPLAQPEVHDLMKALCDLSFSVSLETSGALDISAVDSRVSRVVDLKAPGSGEVHRNLYTNMNVLNAQDQIKFVIASRQDYEWARFKCDEYQLTQKVSDILFSPVHGELAPRELAEWILADQLPVRLQVQLHKYLWNNEPGH
jgi:7-carboxy-7-deazaguanine synthase